MFESFTGAFFVPIKVLRYDFSTDLSLKEQKFTRQCPCCNETKVQDVPHGNL